MTSETARLARMLEMALVRESTRERGELLLPDDEAGKAIYSLMRKMRHVSIYTSGCEIQIKPASHVC